MGMRLGQLVTRFEKIGLRVERPSSGSHCKVYNQDDEMYTVPAHNTEKTEIDDRYIDACCRQLGVDPADIKNKKRFKALVKSQPEKR